MNFSEIANRLTGISTPFGGASWQPAEMEIRTARRLIWPARLEMCQWRRETLDKESVWDGARSMSLSR